MQENVSGSPVIVEANSRNLYRWYSRFTIYTGLPGVVGWEWHQQQQRALNPPEWVTRRVTEIDQFYLGTDGGVASDFLNRYNVKYIIVGQLEQADLSRTSGWRNSRPSTAICGAKCTGMGIRSSMR